MRTKTEVLQEINEMQIFKSALKHFLASYEASQMPECALAAEGNKASVSNTLMALYEELSIINNNQEDYTPTQPQRIRHTASPEEEKAIVAFYADKRFTLTE